MNKKKMHSTAGELFRKLDDVEFQILLIEDPLASEALTEELDRVRIAVEAALKKEMLNPKLDISNSNMMLDIEDRIVFSPKIISKLRRKIGSLCERLGLPVDTDDFTAAA